MTVPPSCRPYDAASERFQTARRRKWLSRARESRWPERSCACWPYRVRTIERSCARSDRLRALIRTAAFVVASRARRSRRGLPAAVGAYTLRASWLRHESLATPQTAASRPPRSLPRGHTRCGVTRPELRTGVNAVFLAVQRVITTPLDRVPLFTGARRLREWHAVERPHARRLCEGVSVP